MALPPLHLGDVRKLPDKAVTYLMLLMLLHLNREGLLGANGVYMSELACETVQMLQF